MNFDDEGWPDLSAIARLAPPPADPVGEPVDWATVESELGTALPSDFTTLADAYGRGQFQDFLSLLVPTGHHPGPADVLDTERDNRMVVGDAEAAWIARHGGHARVGDAWPPFYPSVGGLLPWATTDNGDRICWQVAGEPDTWTCAVWNPRDHYPRDGGDIESHPYPASTLLARWLQGATDSPRLRAADTAGGTWFEPTRELHHVTVTLLESPLDADTCLRLLRSLLDPAIERTAHEDPSVRQWGFVGGPNRWRVTYTSYRTVGDKKPGVGHRLTLAYPHTDDEAARRFIFETTTKLECDIRSIWRENTDGTEWLLADPENP
jgi:hypothetical protein